MTSRLFICVPCKDRRAVVEQCLPTLLASRYSGDAVRCYNDGSTEYDSDWLESLGADWAMKFSGIGVDAQRRMHILDFMEHADEFTHLYLTDSDTLHDPHWRERLLDIHARTGLLTCGYNSPTHEAYSGNTYKREDDVVFRRFAPGVSYLLSREQVKHIASGLPEAWQFDWAIPAMLGYKCAVSDTSCVGHVGHAGMHDQHQKPGYVSAERELNPTQWLVEKRKEVLWKLGLKENE
jgi:hypothetical protein